MAYDLSVAIAGIEALVFRAPTERPIRTSFGTMHSRPMLLVRAIGDDGSEGWGEVWCNFPSVGAEHRAGLIRETLAPLLTAAGRLASPEAAYRLLTDRIAVLAIQSGEPGPLAQAIAGIDIALWDLVARRNGVSVQTLFGGRFTEQVPAYASGINPDTPEAQVEQARSDGHRAFKLKIGFGTTQDIDNLQRLTAIRRTGERLMADANQAWSLGEAVAMAARLAAFDLDWLEEPLRADAPLAEWQQLQRHCPAPLAAGENLRGESVFATAVDDGVLGVIQPDIGKWGGFSGCLPAMRRALAAGRRFCPHWLGGGIGLVASGHLLAIAGGDGRLEMDANRNPLRTLITAFPEVTDGFARLPDGPGLGIVPRLDELKSFAAT